jgi:signal transduction histidine kinase
LAETADTSIVEIRDHGPGVPEELLSQIFKPFFRAEESRDTNSGGIGLGLSIAMRAVQVHQGSITAENAKPGLKVQIVLPRLPATEQFVYSATTADPSTALRSGRDDKGRAVTSRKSGDLDGRS